MSNQNQPQTDFLAQVASILGGLALVLGVGYAIIHVVLYGFWASLLIAATVVIVSLMFGLMLLIGGRMLNTMKRLESKLERNALP